MWPGEVASGEGECPVMRDGTQERETLRDLYDIVDGWGDGPKKGKGEPAAFQSRLLTSVLPVSPSNRQLSYVWYLWA